jgi:hypothetical protein
VVPDDSQDGVVRSILYSTNSAVAEQRLDVGRARCRHAVQLPPNQLVTTPVTWLVVPALPGCSRCIFRKA